MPDGSVRVRAARVRDSVEEAVVGLHRLENRGAVRSRDGKCMERLEVATEGQSKNGFTGHPTTRSDEIPADAQEAVAYMIAVGGEIVEWRQIPVRRDLEDA